MLGAGGGIGGYVSGHQFAVIASGSLTASVDGEGQIDVAADQSVFERLAQLHFQSVEAGGQAQLHVEEAVVDALQAERAVELAVVRQGYAKLRARETGHGIDWHFSSLNYC